MVSLLLDAGRNSWWACDVDAATLACEAGFDFVDARH
jgi:hypothetical protein